MRIVKAETKTITQSFRLTPSLVERIKQSTSHIHGGLSKKIRALIELGMSENKDPLTPQERANIIEFLEAQNMAMVKLGTNINQIAYHLNMGDKVAYSEWLKEAEGLTQALGEVRQLNHEIRKRMTL